MCSLMLDSNKKFTFIFPLLNLYAPYGKKFLQMLNYFISFISEALKFVIFLLKQPKKGQKMKKIYEEEVAFHEVFLEAVPTALVMTILFVSVLDSSKFYFLM